ncbi:MAG: ribonuclease P protein component [Neisseriaceae bacterium]
MPLDALKAEGAYPFNPISVKPYLSLKKSDKLLSSKDFSSVFRNRRACVSRGKIKIFYALSEQQISRLGLIVSKKVARKAVARNYIKRCLREWFRTNRASLPTGDYIFLTQSQFDASQREQVYQELEKFKLNLQKKVL